MHRFIPLALLLTAGCGKDGDTGADTSFSSIRDEILVPSCGFESCHGADAGDLTLDAGGAYAALVDVPSAAATGEVLVIPGDADGSYLVQKLEDASGIAGEGMPPGGQLLDADKIARVRGWISAGAADD
jgi:hypothetical protein